MIKINSLVPAASNKMLVEIIFSNTNKCIKQHNELLGGAY